MIEFLIAAHGAAVDGAAAGLGGPAEMWAAIVRDFSNIGEPGALSAFLTVLMIDLVLAGDNAIVVGALAAGLPAEQRRKVILIGVIAALVLRIGFALIVTQLLQVVGLIFAVALMGLAANVIAKYIERYRWIAYVGLLVILWVAGKMIWEGWHDVAPVLGFPA